ncbi:phospholipase D family protein [Neobacillus niacini]|uniref:phospholipase D family protein n=1 Tax=Neobacillus niacini TaxID=86668 RepID=UPI0005ED7FBC|nr:phospholipase D family protein [Neobacillus niacini]
MSLLNEDLHTVIENAVKEAQHSVLIVSPYIKYNTAARIVNIVKNKNLDLKILTLPPGEEYITGATDLEAILTLQTYGFKIKMLPYLHAKLYLIDEKCLFIGSANFTNRGLGLAKEANKEILIEKRANHVDLTLIRNDFWNHEEVRSIDYFKDFKEQIIKLQDKYGSMSEQLKAVHRDFNITFKPYSPHEELLIKLKEKGTIESYSQMKNGYYKHAFTINDKQIVKIMRSKVAEKNQELVYETFNYQISKKSAALFQKRKVKALILILEEPDQFVCLPTTFIIEKIQRLSNTKKMKDYQFKVKRKGDELFLSIKGKRSVQKIDIKKYEGAMRFKVLK